MEYSNRQQRKVREPNANGRSVVGEVAWAWAGVPSDLDPPCEVLPVRWNANKLECSQKPPARCPLRRPQHVGRCILSPTGRHANMKILTGCSAPDRSLLAADIRQLVTGPAKSPRQRPVPSSIPTKPGPVSVLRFPVCTSSVAVSTSTLLP